MIKYNKYNVIHTHSQVGDITSNSYFDYLKNLECMLNIIERPFITYGNIMTFLIRSIDLVNYTNAIPNISFLHVWNKFHLVMMSYFYNV